VQIDDAITAFHAHFGGPPEVATRAPGRVNIIGEHTDYNGGFVLPMAIGRETVILARRRPGLTLRAVAHNLEATAEVSLESFHRQPGAPWLDYVIGVAGELEKLGKPVTGADLLIAGDIPIGCGLSSSAALEMAALCLFEQLGNFTMEGPEAALLGQRVENGFLGLSSGIMDQFIVRMGKAGHALFLDCRSLAYEHIPVAFPDARFVIANTNVTRGLTSSKYNERVAECSRAVEALQATGQQGAQLRDYTPDDLDALHGQIDEVVFRRARHVLTEDVRTQAACDALRVGDAQAVGQLMNESDESLRGDYEVTCAELDAMTRIARGLPGCHGSRMTGAGFGGCTVSLVATEATEAFSASLLEAYGAATGLQGEVIVSAPSAGAGLYAL
jgi:galactokinase